ncbi:hypothetical protein, partial [Nocardioides alcanivorans]|uniref:hypothetical protein n=1 Tax=Nocardioides alcanivorans TaxID=2897352 RepID=UPI001F3EA459
MLLADTGGAASTTRRPATAWPGGDVLLPARGTVTTCTPAGHLGGPACRRVGGDEVDPVAGPQHRDCVGVRDP